MYKTRSCDRHVRHALRLLLPPLAGPRGLEPRSSDSKSDILPLDDGPAYVLVRPAGLAPALRLWKSRVPLRTLQPHNPAKLHHCSRFWSPHLVAGQGLEPQFPGSAPGVLPLDDPAAFALSAGNCTRVSGLRLRRADCCTTESWQSGKELHPYRLGWNQACSYSHHRSAKSPAFGAPGGARTHTYPVKSRRLCLSSSRRVRVLPPTFWIVPPGGFEPPPHGVKIRCAAC